MKKLYLIVDDKTDASLPDFFRCCAGDGSELILINASCTDAFEFVCEWPIIFAAGDPDMTSSPALLEAVVCHTLLGGALLMAAGAMTSIRTHEWNLLSAARRVRTLPYGELTLEMVNDADETPVQTRVWDEAWMFERSVFDQSQVLLSIVLGEQRYPVIWSRAWFRGRVWCVGSELPASAQQVYLPVIREILREMKEEG